MNKQKGFTIVELIVVIAIIAVLSTIVLVNVTKYINNGKDAAIKGNMDTILTNAAVFFDANGNYDSYNSDTKYSGPADAIQGIKSAPTYVTATVSGHNIAFCVTASLFDGTTYCVDSTGFKGTNVACAIGNTACN